MNNNLAQLKFKLTTTMLFSNRYGQQQIGDNKNAVKSLAILIAMRMQRYGAGHIAQ
jgi:hypothetical protein